MKTKKENIIINKNPFYDIQNVTRAFVKGNAGSGYIRDETVFRLHWKNHQNRLKFATK